MRSSVGPEHAVPAIVPSVRRFALNGEHRRLDGGLLRIAGDGPETGALAAALPAGTVRAVKAEDPATADVTVRLDPLWEPPFTSAGLSPTGTPVDESYRIRVAGGLLEVSAATAAGLFHGLTVITQAVAASAGGRDAVLPLFHAEDAPAWRWRGLSFDAVRCAFELDDLRRVIDLLALHRANVLHLHLTDSQAWRVQMPAYPKLTPTGTTSYTAGDLAELGEYAAARFVTLVPEIDLPGHTHAALAAYPELLGAEPPEHPWLGHLRPGVPAAMRFARDAIEMLCALSPGPYVHIGGDEAFAMDAGEYAEFVTTVAGWVRELGKRPIGWQEVCRAPGAFAAGDVIQAWMGDSGFTPEQIDRIAAVRPFLRAPLEETVRAAEGDPARIVASSASVLVSSMLPYYLDRRCAEASTDPEQNAAMGRVGMPDYPRKATSELYATQAQVIADLAGQSDRLAGIEAAIWAESIGGFDDMALLVLPRLALFAEHMWAPEPVAWPEMVRRLGVIAPRWEALGFGAYFRSEEIFGPAG